jgi:para-aminobenzoate synthetase/4-amino-4-deoxychorismate lyase
MFEHSPRIEPDPSRGVFETLLVVEGEPVEMETHLRRLAQSLEALYSQTLPLQIEEKLRQAAAGIRLGRLRVTVSPAEDGLRLDLLAGGVEPEAVFPARGVKLRMLSIAGGLGAHKWVDRKGINRPAPDEVGALIGDEGEVLEAGWANVFAVRNGTLFTPPLDGRLLAGTTRGALLGLAAKEGIANNEEPIHPDDLLSADEVFLTGSIRGIEPALQLDGQPLAGCGEISHRLAAPLRERWGLSGSDVPQASATAPRPGQLSQ